MDETWLTQGEVKGLTGWQDRWLRESRDQLGYRPGEAGRNGKPEPLYALSCLPGEAQLKWARQQKVIPIEFEPSGGPGQLALDLILPAGSELSDKDRAEAEQRFQVIAPLIEPRQHAGAWAGRNRTEVVKLIAKNHGKTERTIFRWLKRWQGNDSGRRGLAALVDGSRADKGKPRYFNGAALDLVVALVTPKKGADGYGEMTVQDAFTAYEEERQLRVSLVGVTLENGDAKRLSNYLDEGRLVPEAQLPRVSYSTFRRWVQRLPKPVLTLAPELCTDSLCECGCVRSGLAVVVRW